MARDLWQICIDTGGTFTDCIALTPDGAWRRAKLLSSGALRLEVARAPGPCELELSRPLQLPPAALTGLRLGRLNAAAPQGLAGPAVVSVAPDGGRLTLEAPHHCAAGDTVELRGDEPAPVLAARLVTGTPTGQPLPPHQLRFATTLGTNALLQRRGARLALFITRGFGDLLRIGTQQRPDLFALRIVRPEPLAEVVLELEERVDARGAVLQPLSDGQVRQAAAQLLEQGIDSAAVALANSYRNPRHERRVAALLRQAGLQHVSCSSELVPVIGLLTRTETAVTNAFLAPLVDRYLGRVQRGMGAGAAAPPWVMSSGGGLVAAGDFRAKDSLLSGPAGGVVGAAQAGRSLGLTQLISFDMGGTSTDVARYDGAHDYRFEQQIGETHLLAEALAIETVAAGGGSICALQQGTLGVGPQSAGASPGPACYGAGGPLTVTDVNLLLGRLDPQRFRIPVSAAAARRAAAALADELQQQTGRQPELDTLLEGLLELANERMAEAIRRVSLQRGYDPADYTLVAFGGAGPQHACGVAQRLGMRRVLVPAEAGLLSAVGLGHARLERFAVRQVLQPLEQVGPQLEAWFQQLAAQASAELRGAEAHGASAASAAEPPSVRRLLSLRLQGQDTPLTLDLAPGADPAALFVERFAQLYGYPPGQRPIEVESMRVVVAAAASVFAAATAEPRDVAAASVLTAATAEPRDVATPLRARFHGAWREVPCVPRDAAVLARPLDGPALVLDAHCTTVVEPGWRAQRQTDGALLLQREPAARASVAPERAGAPTAHRQHQQAVALELFVGRLSAVATEMGELLRRCAISTNIKERADFSCAVLDARGQLVVNAPHIPVHLGSLGLCVRSVVQVLPLGPGDVAVTNHPAHGGSHLPDVTVVTPVHHDDQLVGYVASRAHHAEIGGIRPGSMPPDACCLAEEGVVIPPTLLVARGEPRWSAMRRLLSRGPYPSRCVEDNLADLAAQLAAGRQGAAALQRLARSQGAQRVQAQMDELARVAWRQIARALAALPDGDYRARTTLDDGTPLTVRIGVAGQRATVDFSGSALRHPGNLNATPAVVRGVVMYVLRLLVQRPLPLNEGLMRAVTLRLPPGLLNPRFESDAHSAPAVVGGNVETSQRLVDLLLQALGLAACSQGTMNNLVFGNDRLGYYETVGGGTGAGPGFAGASGVHSHMTNTRITDVELLEQRYPVRVERFALRRGSGGAGRHPGGDGLIRELRFLAPLTVSLLTQRRARGPCGLAGGRAGQAGRQLLRQADGRQQLLEAIDGCAVRPGDRLLLETPGGGGYGCEPGEEG